MYYAESGASQRASVVIYDRARSAISEIDPAGVDWAAIFRGAAWFHVTGITPALGAKAAAAQLSNATIISIPGIGHAVSPWSPCAQAVIVSFLTDPAAPDASCVGALKPPSFTSVASP